MADKSFGVKELNLLNASGTPTVTSPNNLNLNANTVAISTSCTIGSNLDVDGTTNLDNVDIVGVTTIRNASGNKLYEGSANASKLFHNGSERLQTETYGIDINGTLGADQINCSGVSTITVPANANPHSSWDVVNNSASSYRFTGPGQDGAEDNPNIYLVRGQRYVFKMNASGHPFQIRVANGGAAYSDGVTNNGAQTGNVVFNVQHDAPAQLFYQCTSHGSMVGNIYIVGGPQVISGVVTATTFSGNLSGGTVSGTTGTFTNNLSVAQNILHIGVTDTKIEFLTDTIALETAGTERLRIESNGDVEWNNIGTPTPGYNNSTVGMGFDTDTIKFSADSSERLRITSGGNLMLRSATVNYLVMGSSGDSGFDATISNNMNWIRGNQDNLQMNTATGGFMGFEIGGSEKFKIASSGQFGIGGANYGTAGQVITSQGASSAPQWASPVVAGSILQTVYGTTTGEGVTTSSSFQNFTALNTNITRMSSNSHLWVWINAVRLLVQSDSNEARVRITDGTSATTPYRLVNYDSDGNYLSFNPCLNWYWTKSHTAGTTVTITPQFRNTNGSGNIIWGDNGDTTMMIIQEIAR